MLELLWLIPACPLAGFILLAVFGGRLTPRHIAWIGVGSVGLSALITGLVAATFVAAPPMGDRFLQILWKWMDVSGFSPAIAFHLDALSLIMILVITFVGFLIHVYSSEFMIHDEGYRRFFAYMNLFVASMLTLVLADNLLLLYLGWEGVGLCSYLLIGFWYRESANGRAAQKAFIVTRIGDTAFAIGLFLLFTHLGTLNIQDVLIRAHQEWGVGAVPAVAATLLLLGGAVGKSAQLPLQTWLPDAMAGPTPVSALIHAATMVTAGVYLIARLHTLYELAPAVQFLVGIIGAVTLLIAASSALVQRDIKRVLAYSTISQIGYMFLALGVGAWSAALFHFMTHAFFKALLFLSAGAVIFSLHEEHDIFRMGGLRSRLPIVFWTFLIGAASLAGLPLVTAGFYSKDWILWEAWSSPHGNVWLWGAGVVGALLTAIYSFRLVFYVFFDEPKTVPHARPGLSMTFPLIVLAVLSVSAGFLETPRSLGQVTLFSRFMQPALPAVEPAAATMAAEVTEQAILIAVALIGMGLAYVLFLRRRDLPDAMARTPIGTAVSRFLFEGWRFDALYDRFIIGPFLWVAAVNRSDGLDRLYAGIAWLNRWLHRGLQQTQTGQVRWYATVMAAGAIVIVALALFI
ncbi:MAG TPA: NADH-quinone oxidoreductase subunit L [Nitrospiraceae bacterium]|nr:NADH-quinone oxidoreductase subunit L [Nitrospiraceae bacterium]